MKRFILISLAAVLFLAVIMTTVYTVERSVRRHRPTPTPMPTPTTQPAPTAALTPTAAPTPAPSATPSPAGTATPSPTPVTPQAQIEPGVCPNLVHRVGENLVLNGQPYVFVGLNVPYLAKNDLPESEVPKVMDQLAGWGVTMVRLWVTPGVDLDRFQRLLDLAKPRGIRFIVVLQDYYWYKDARWFRDTYKTVDMPHVEQVVTRFRGRPEVAIWEVMNEPWCGANQEVSDQKCYDEMLAWAKDTTALIRRLDPCRPISLGLTGTRNLPIEAKAYRALQAIDTVDIVSMHRVPQDWYKDAKELTIAHELGKPIFLGEVYERGFDKECNQLSPFVVPERARKIEKDMQKALELGVDGYMLWDYIADSVQDANGTWHHYCDVDGYTSYDPIGPVIKALQVPRVAIP